MGNCLCPQESPLGDETKDGCISLKITDLPVALPRVECDDVCPVCLEGLSGDPSVLSTACCKRAFHHECLVLGLDATKNLCLLCRAVLCIPDRFTTVTCNFSGPVSEETRMKVVALLPERLNRLREAR